jgi:hypothetical protein
MQRIHCVSPEETVENVNKKVSNRPQYWDSFIKYGIIVKVYRNQAEKNGSHVVNVVQIVYLVPRKISSFAVDVVQYPAKERSVERKKGCFTIVNPPKATHDDQNWRGKRFLIDHGDKLDSGAFRG